MSATEQPASDHRGPSWPRVVAIVPARGGSKGLPDKNLARVAGRRLVERAVTACLAAQTIDLVVVTTDHPDVADAAASAGARVVHRPAELAGDTASSEGAVLHALDSLASEGLLPDVTVLVQCTSPFIDAADLDAAVKLVLDGDLDCCFSAVATHAFLWRAAGGTVDALNHDASRRPRRQEVEADLRETGAFYAMRTYGLRESGHRFFGKVGVQPVRAATALEIDGPEDLNLARALAPVVEPLRESPIDVDAVVTDFDGVHTDDRASLDQDGRETVAVSRSDGLGVARLLAAGVPLLIMSTETNPVVTARGHKLGVPVLQGVRDKRRVLVEWMAVQGLDPSRVAYVGNDVNDLGALSVVGWPVAVANAHPGVRAMARSVLARPGGDGAVRELCDRVVAARDVAARDVAPQRCRSQAVASS